MHERHYKTEILACFFAGMFAITPFNFAHAAEPQNGYFSAEKLGEQLFFDTALSQNRTQSCATCHNPDSAFIDSKASLAGRAVSIGDDGFSLGGRNAPTLTYAATVPAFHQREDGSFAGGLFWDGRAYSGLSAQAGGPLLNPVEMGMPNKESVAERLKENPDYNRKFTEIYGTGIFDTPDQAFDAMTKAIAAYEQSPQFMTFDSRYDRYLRGEEKFNDQEELGRVLFFSQQFTNCNSCHAIKGKKGYEDAIFTDNRYINIGVPINPDLATQTPDPGLGGVLSDELAQAQKGKFRVPTLRNVAVTGPYMHNGVFKDLRTVILFYNKYNSLKPSRQINPETGKDFGPPETPENIDMETLKKAPALDDKRIDALVAFLKTLTDRRYETILAKQNDRHNDNKK